MKNYDFVKRKFSEEKGKKFFVQGKCFSFVKSAAVKKSTAGRILRQVTNEC